ATVSQEFNEQQGDDRQRRQPKQRQAANEQGVAVPADALDEGAAGSGASLGARRLTPRRQWRWRSPQPHQALLGPGALEQDLVGDAGESSGHQEVFVDLRARLAAVGAEA